MLATHPFEELQLCPGEAGVASHAVERKRPKILPALRATLEGERLATLARTSSGDATRSALGTGPKARAVAAGAIIALVPKALDELSFKVPNLRVRDANLRLSEVGYQVGRNPVLFR
jgi:hypothetical protein